MSFINIKLLMVMGMFYIVYLFEYCTGIYIFRNLELGWREGGGRNPEFGLIWIVSLQSGSDVGIGLALAMLAHNRLCHLSTFN